MTRSRGEDAGRFDLLLETFGSTRCVVAIESKVGAGFTHDQLEKYWTQLRTEAAFPNIPLKSRYLVTLTLPGAEPTDEFVKAKLRWPQIDGLLGNLRPREGSIVSFVIEQFVAFLKDHGMAKLDFDTCSPGVLAEWKSVKNADGQLAAILGRLRQNFSKEFGRKEIQRDLEWVGLWSLSKTVYSGFGVSRIEDRQSLFGWVEFQIPEEMAADWSLAEEFRDSYEEAKEILPAFKDTHCRNLTEGHRRVVLASRISGCSEKDGNGEAVYTWLSKATEYGFSQTS